MKKQKKKLLVRISVLAVLFLFAVWLRLTAEKGQEEGKPAAETDSTAYLVDFEEDTIRQICVEKAGEVLEVSWEDGKFVPQEIPAEKRELHKVAEAVWQRASRPPFQKGGKLFTAYSSSADRRGKTGRRNNSWNIWN